MRRCSERATPCRGHRHRPGHAARQRHGRRRGARCSTAEAAIAPIASFDASGFPGAHRRRGEGVRRARRLNDAQAAQARQPRTTASPRRRRRGAARCRRARPTPATATRWACVAGAGMLGGISTTSPRFSATSRRDGELNEECLIAAGPAAADPIAFCRAPGQRRRGAARPPLRHPRLREHGAHRLRLGRSGDRHGDASDAPRHRRPRALRRLRLDAPPARSRRLLSAAGIVARQRRARARQPALRSYPQRLRARRGRGISRSRRVGAGAPARRPHLRRARRRRQLAQQLPHHRLPPVGRRSDPGHATGACTTRAWRRRRSTT